MSDQIDLTSAAVLPSGFHIREVDSRGSTAAATPTNPDLGPLADFVGDWHGHGFNTIFRPNNPITPTPLPIPQNTSDNILELNLTREVLSFSPSLGSVPNRGAVQGDVFLNGVPYLQSISDVNDPRKPVGIHLEPGIWVIVPSTTDPAEGPTLARMASIPHGTTIEAQGTFFTVAGGPKIDPVDMTPFTTVVPPATPTPIRFASQTADNRETPRLPQDLTPFIANNTITQAMLDDPNTVLRDAIVGQNIISTNVIIISTQPATPLFGGGTDNIAFLLGDAAAQKPNAQALQMSAIFWIETVEHTLQIPIFKPGQAPLALSSDTSQGARPVVKFLVMPPTEITAPRTIKFHTKQIQYTQTVMLNFKGLTWPHISVATLVPAHPVVVPASAWSQSP
jgi:hypothetical protein